MNTNMHPIFTDNVLTALSQLPVGTVIMIGFNESVEVYKDSRDLEDGVTTNKFFRTTIWADEKGE